MKGGVRRIYLVIGVIFFFTMLALPTSFQLERAVFLVLLAGGAVVQSLNGGWSLDRSVLGLGILCVTASLLFMLNGLANDAPGALRVVTVLVLWPMLYLLFVGIVRRVETVVLFEKVVISGIIASGLMGLSLVLGALVGRGAELAGNLEFQGAAVGVYNGFVEYRLYNMTTLIYGLPFLAVLALMPKEYIQLPLFWRASVWVAFAVTLVACAVSGRRVFWLLALMTPFLAMGFLLLSGVRIDAKRLLYLAVSSLLAFTFMVQSIGLDPSLVRAQLESAFDASVDASAGARMEQFWALLSGWADRPMLGHGAGASSDLIVRSEEIPWSYELSYVALLFQTGVVGIVIYSAAVAWIFVMGLRTVRNRPKSASIILPLLSGLAGFLFVNATNPYLLKFDYLWTIFLPLAAIKVCTMARAPLMSSSSTGTQDASFPTASRP